MESRDSQNKRANSNFDPLSSSNTRSNTILSTETPHPSPKFRIPKIFIQPRRSYKTWIRCTMTFGVTMILLVSSKPSNYMGQAGFFAAILAIMLPPSFALSVFMMAIITLLIGMLLGWAWACAAMASALSVRSSSLLATQQQKLQSMIDPTSSMTVPNQILFHTFSGVFLDPWSSAVHGVFLFIGTFVMGALRAYLPRMALLSIFGTIVIDVIATMGPLLPTAQYTVVKMFFIPTGFYICVAIASLIFIFPESLSHIWLTSLQSDFITPVKELLNLLDRSLTTVPSDHVEWQKLTDEGNEIRGRLIDGTEALLEQIALIDLDVSVGRLGPEELKKICGELKGFLFRAACLHSFHALVNDKNKNDEETEALCHDLSPVPSRTVGHFINPIESISTAAHSDNRDGYGYGDTDNIPLRSLPTKSTATSINGSTSNLNSGMRTPTHKTGSAFHHLRSKIAHAELEHGHDFDSLLPLLASSSLELRTASIRGAQCLSDWVARCNSNRWGSYFGSSFLSRLFGGRKNGPDDVYSKRAEMEEVVSVLEQRLTDFRTKERVRVIGPYEKFFDPVTKKMKAKAGEDGGEMFTSRSLYLSFVFIDTLDAFCESLLKCLRAVISIDAQRQKTRIWFPGRSRFTVSKLKENITENDAGGGNTRASMNPVSMGTARDPTTFDEDTSAEGENSKWGGDLMMDDSKPVKRNPDALPPSSMSGKLYLKFCAFFRFLKTAEGIFALRCALLSVALWVPGVCASTAWLYYEQKGMWALIMGQMALAVYAGDQISSFVFRMIGTVIGLVIGVALWYMGAGTGNGNAYALVVITTVLLSPFIYLRIVSSQQMSVLWIMISVTGVFVVGYSWINANLPSLGNPGVGLDLGWKRALLVMIGFTGAFVIMIFPHPQSSRVLVRKTAAGVISELGRIFGGEIEAFLAEETRARHGIHEHVVFKKEEEEEDQISVKERRVRRIAKRFVEVATRLRDIEPSLDTAKFEPQLTGIWPQKEYRNFFELERRMLAALVLLILSFEKLDTKHCSMLVHQTPYLNPNFISDIFSTLSILSSSLLSGTPIPPYLPKLTERLIYHAQVHRGPVNGDEADSIMPYRRRDDINGIDSFAVGLGLGLDEITLDMLLDEQLPAYSTAVVALSSIVFRIDAMTAIVKTLCGQATIPGYQALQRNSNDLDWEERFAGTSGPGQGGIGSGSRVQ